MSTNDAFQCPKCGYRRAAQESAPAWQCPACGIAYHKYARYQQHAAAARSAKAVPGVTAPGWLRDTSLWSLVATNLAALVFGLAADWSLPSMLLVYWGQSVIIGIAAVLRILALHDFSTEGFEINGERAAEAPTTKSSTALFFVMHYGIFHFVYLMFLIVQAEGGEFGWSWWLIMLGFAVNHLFSLRHNIALDRVGRPNIGTLMFMPYLRILPMHMVILFGSAMPGAQGSMVLFVLLKTLADGAMHVAEHRYLSRVRQPGSDATGALNQPVDATRATVNEHSTGAS